MKNKFFILILFLTIFLRFYKLGQVPTSLNWDENSNAYNAYSILKSGRDEYGNLLPLYNRSFDDYKPPIYMYLNIPSIAIFGLTPFAARLPSAVFGVLTVIAIYYLTKRLFNNEKIALWSMFLLAISTWHLQFSRVGFEANVGLFFAVSSFTSLLYAINFKNGKTDKKNILLLILSAILFGLSFYSYHSERIFIPVLFLIFIVIYKKELTKFSKKYILLFFITVALLIAPFFVFAPSKAIFERLQSTSQETTIKNIDFSVQLMNEDGLAGQKISSIVHNRRLLIIRNYTLNYLTHFDLNFLFTRGDDNFRHHTEGMGMLFLYQLPLVLLAFYLIFKNLNTGSIFLLFWLFLSPLPAVPTNAVPHAIRSYPMVIALQIMLAIAVVFLQAKIKQKLFVNLILFFLIIISMLTYLHNYYTHYLKDHPDAWQYGYSQAVKKTSNLKDNFRKVIVDPSIEQGYIFFLYNTQYNPILYQKFGNQAHFDKYYFESSTPTDSNDLFVSTADKFPSAFTIVDTIKYPDGKDAIKIGHP